MDFGKFEYMQPIKTIEVRGMTMCDHNDQLALKCLCARLVGQFWGPPHLGSKVDASRDPSFAWCRHEPGHEHSQS